MNPYRNCYFFDFFLAIGSRIKQLLTNSLEYKHLYSDEIQLFTLLFISLAASIVGVFLVLRKQTMLANALSHTVLFGVFLSFMIMKMILGCSAGSINLLSVRSIFISATLSALLTGYITEFIFKIGKYSYDVATSISSSLLLSLGVIALSVFAKDSHICLDFIVGCPDALVSNDVLIAFISFIVVAALVKINYKSLLVSSFDSFFSYSIGFSKKKTDFIMMLLISFVSVAALQAIGFVLTLAFFVLSTAIIKKHVSSVKNMLLYSSLINVSAVLSGVALSRHWFTIFGYGLSTSGMIIFILSAYYVLFSVFNMVKKYSISRSKS